MSLLLDTHALHWFLLDDPRLSTTANKAIADHPEPVLVSPASLWEIAIKISLGKYTRHTWIFRRDARLSRPIAVLRLLAIEPAIPRRHAVLSGTIDAPRLPQNPCATGI